MRILLPVSPDTDLQRLGPYFALRFDTAKIDLDVLMITASPAACGDEDGATLDDIARDFLFTYRVRSVRVHLMSGDVTESLIACALQYHSNAILVHDAAGQGRIFNTGIHKLARTLFKRTRCSLEVVAASALAGSSAEAPMQVIIPVCAAQLSRLPVDRLVALPWQQRSNVHLCVQRPPAVDANALEVSPSSILLAQQAQRDDYPQLEDSLGALCQELAARMGERVDVGFSILPDQPDALAHRMAALTGPTLLLQICRDPAQWRAQAAWLRQKLTHQQHSLLLLQAQEKGRSSARLRADRVCGMHPLPAG